MGGGKGKRKKGTVGEKKYRERNERERMSRGDKRDNRGVKETPRGGKGKETERKRRKEK